MRNLYGMKVVAAGLLAMRLRTSGAPGHPVRRSRRGTERAHVTAAPTSLDQTACASSKSLKVNALRAAELMRLEPRPCE